MPIMSWVCRIQCLPLQGLLCLVIVCVGSVMVPFKYSGNIDNLILKRQQISNVYPSLSMTYTKKKKVFGEHSAFFSPLCVDPISQVTGKKKLSTRFMASTGCPKKSKIRCNIHTFILYVISSVLFLDAYCHFEVNGYSHCCELI